MVAPEAEGKAGAACDPLPPVKGFTRCFDYNPA
jgi:hypothetical protein